MVLTDGPMNPAPNMLDENAVVDAVCRFLGQHGYSIKSRCSTAERGIDVCAEKSATGQRIHVEAKGATSSRPTSPRFGKPYTQSQASVSPHFLHSAARPTYSLKTPIPHRVAACVPRLSYPWGSARVSTALCPGALNVPEHALRSAPQFRHSIPQHPISALRYRAPRA